MYLDVFKLYGALFALPEFKEPMEMFIYLLVETYRDHLGLPERDSDEFEMMKPEFQEQMDSFYWTADTDIDFRIWITSFDTGPSQLPRSSISRWLGEAYINLFDPLRHMFKGMNLLLNSMEELALAILEDHVDREINFKV